MGAPRAWPLTKELPKICAILDGDKGAQNDI
jgi:hypothetical protein